MQEKLFNMVNKYDKFIEVLDWYESERRHVGGISHTDLIFALFQKTKVSNSNVYTESFYGYLVKL